MSIKDLGVNHELAYRNPVTSRGADLEQTTSNAIGGRVTDFGIQLAGHCVAPILQIIPQSDQEEYIIVRVQSDSDSKTNLPPDLQLLVLDANGEAMCSAQCEYDVPAFVLLALPGDIERTEHIGFLETRSGDGQNCIQLRFRGQPGYRFTVKVALGRRMSPNIS